MPADRLVEAYVKIKLDPEEREKAYVKAAAAGLYAADNDGLAQFLEDIMGPVASYNSPPANAPPGTPIQVQLTQKQAQVAHLMQAGVEKRASANTGLKAAVAAGLLGLGTLAFSYLLPQIKGIETHTDARKAIWEERIDAHRGTRHGQDPWYIKDISNPQYAGRDSSDDRELSDLTEDADYDVREEINQIVSDEREDGRDVGFGIAALLVMIAAGLGIYGIARKDP